MTGNPEKPNERFSTQLKGHSTGIQHVGFCPSKETELCSVSRDGAVKFWDARTKSCVNEVKGLGSVAGLAWVPDGSNVVVGNKVCLRWDVAISHSHSEALIVSAGE